MLLQREIIQVDEFSLEEIIVEIHCTYTMSGKWGTTTETNS